MAARPRLGLFRASPLTLSHSTSLPGGGASWGRSAGAGSSARGSSSSWSSGFDADFDFGRAKGPQEEFYGLGDFFRDLDKELENIEVRSTEQNARQYFASPISLTAAYASLQKRASGSKSRGDSGSRREKSLLEELAEIGVAVGEELVEFLEAGLSNVEDPQKVDRAGSSRASSDGRNSSRAAPKQPPPPPPPPPRQPPPAAKAEESVDDMLRKLKKEMGLE